MIYSDDTLPTTLSYLQLPFTNLSLWQIHDLCFVLQILQFKQGHTCVNVGLELSLEPGGITSGLKTKGNGFRFLKYNSNSLAAWGRALSSPSAHFWLFMDSSVLSSVVICSCWELLIAVTMSYLSGCHSALLLFIFHSLTFSVCPSTLFLEPTVVLWITYFMSLILST